MLIRVVYLAPYMLARVVYLVPYIEGCAGMQGRFISSPTSRGMHVGKGGLSLPLSHGMCMLARVVYLAPTPLPQGMSMLTMVVYLALYLEGYADWQGWFILANTSRAVHVDMGSFVFHYIEGCA